MAGDDPGRRKARPGSGRTPGSPLAALAALLWAGTAHAQQPAGPGPAAAAHREASAGAALFVTADRCMGCHNEVVAPSGEDVSIGYDWRASMMANASRDPYWRAAVRREVMDHPAAREAIEDKCATCHMPMARYASRLAGTSGRVFGNLAGGGAAPPIVGLAADGVSCSVCHQIRPDNLGEESSFTGGFEVEEPGAAGSRAAFGPFEVDAGRTRVMSSATGFAPEEGSHIQSSELCASCHTLYTESLDETGAQIATLPEQVPYLEWRHSAYAREGRSCQSCHMPVVEDPVPVTGVLGQPRTGVSRHVFRGGNFFMLRMLNRYRHELGVQALSQELETAARRTVEHLQSRSAVLSIEHVAVEDGRLAAEVSVRNLAGHKLPSAYPSRRAWIRLAVRDGTGALVFESGAFRADGSIAQNDNDEDPARFEPHHREITRADQVQVYESILEDPDGRVTTGLLTGVGYVKDNRILPRGFDKETAPDDVAVRGAASVDPDFSEAGDRILYRVPLGGAEGPFTVEAELWYQPIAFRWARNLAEYDAPETRRFVSYYESMASGSAVVLARTAGEAR